MMLAQGTHPVGTLSSLDDEAAACELGDDALPVVGHSVAAQPGVSCVGLVHGDLAVQDAQHVITLLKCDALTGAQDTKEEIDVGGGPPSSQERGLDLLPLVLSGDVRHIIIYHVALLQVKEACGEEDAVHHDVAVVIIALMVRSHMAHL